MGRIPSATSRLLFRSTIVLPTSPHGNAGEKVGTAVFVHLSGTKLASAASNMTRRWPTSVVLGDSLACSFSGERKGRVDVYGRRYWQQVNIEQWWSKAMTSYLRPSKLQKPTWAWPDEGTCLDTLMGFCYGTNKTSRAWIVKNHHKEGASPRAKLPAACLSSEKATLDSSGQRQRS